MTTRDDTVTADRVPYGQIRWWVGRQRVSRPLSEIGDDIARMMGGVTRLQDGTEVTATADEVDRAVAYALECHGENRRQYQAVMSGRF